MDSIKHSRSVCLDSNYQMFTTYYIIRYHLELKISSNWIRSIANYNDILMRFFHESSFYETWIVYLSLGFFAKCFGFFNKNKFWHFSVHLDSQKKNSQNHNELNKMLVILSLCQYWRVCMLCATGAQVCRFQISSLLNFITPSINRWIITWSPGHR